MSTDDPILRANTSWLPATEAEALAIDRHRKYITENFDQLVAETFPETSKPSVGSTTSSDTESPSSGDSVTGYEDLWAVMDLDYSELLKWAALRNSVYRESVAQFAQAARGQRATDDKHPPTIAECEWHAEQLTNGITKSYPHEMELLLIVLEEKRNA